ncbi:hypothetical protein AB0J72_21825 [Dactylosporangium sp. NPDC049742]|uniref:DUF6892 domain-containing protein n=1 Tax=Dactylosporangium sp. NPDC049742 TaxID=3154737 RepID=UPI00344708F7
MDDCLRLALLECDYTSPVRGSLSRQSVQDRQARHGELLRAPIAGSVGEARWTEDALLRSAVPAGTDPVIRGLDGIAAFPELRVLHLPASAVPDLTPLTELPSLALLSLGVTPATDLRPLLDCPRLTRVDVPAPAAQHDVLVALAARGVHVDQLLPARDAAPFGNPILKLAVLDLLGVPLPLPEPFDEYTLDDANLTRVLAIELTQQQLDSVERLHWTGGGYDIQHAVWPQWDGETGEFDLRSLRGIESLRNLKHLQVTPLSLLPPADLAALRATGVTVTELHGGH